MNQQEQINKILDLENAIREKQVSKLSAHTLVPIGLVVGVVSSVFFFGVTFQRLNALEASYIELKSSFKEEIIGLRTDIKALTTSVADLRILLVKDGK